MYLREQPWYKKLDWTNVSFLGSAHIIAAFGVWYLIQRGAIPWQTWALFLFMLGACGLSITAGYHRLFSHKTYQSGSFVKLFWLLFGAGAFQNNARVWSSDHRRHHKFVDTDKDPYNIKEGFLFAHIGWVLLKYDKNVIKYDDVPDLDADPLVRFQEKYYALLAVGVGLVFPALVAMLWGDLWGGFFLAGWIRIILNEHFTFSINSFAHIFGSQPYNDKDSSRDNWFFAYFTYGEGYHNFHHKFPFDYRNGVRLHQWDPSKWAIKFLSWFGLTGGLRQVPDAIILQARLKMEEKRLLDNIEKVKTPVVSHWGEINKEFVQNARAKFETAYIQVQHLKAEVKRLKNENIDAFNEKMAKLKEELALAKIALEKAVREWVELCSGFGVQPTVSVV